MIHKNQESLKGGPLDKTESPFFKDLKRFFGNPTIPLEDLTAKQREQIKAMDVPELKRLFIQNEENLDVIGDVNKRKYKESLREELKQQLIEKEQEDFLRSIFGEFDKKINELDVFKDDRADVSRGSSPPKEQAQFEGIAEGQKLIATKEELKTPPVPPKTQKARINTDQPANPEIKPGRPKKYQSNPLFQGESDFLGHLDDLNFNNQKIMDENKDANTKNFKQVSDILNMYRNAYRLGISGKSIAIDLDELDNDLEKINSLLEQEKDEVFKAQTNQVKESLLEIRQKIESKIQKSGRRNL